MQLNSYLDTGSSRDVRISVPKEYSGNTNTSRVNKYKINTVFNVITKNFGPNSAEVRSIDIQNFNNTHNTINSINNNYNIQNSNTKKQPAQNKYIKSSFSNDSIGKLNKNKSLVAIDETDQLK